MVTRRAGGATASTPDVDLDALLEALLETSRELEQRETAADAARDRLAGLVLTLRRRGCSTACIARVVARGRGERIPAAQLRAAYDRLRRQTDRWVKRRRVSILHSPGTKIGSQLSHGPAWYRKRSR